MDMKWPKISEKSPIANTHQKKEANCYNTPNNVLQKNDQMTKQAKHVIFVMLQKHRPEYHIPYSHHNKTQ